MSYTVYLKKYAHGFVVLCFVVVIQSFIMNSHRVFIHIHQGCFAGTGAIVRLPQCQWSKPDGYVKISQCITTTKHSKAKSVCIFLGIYCTRVGAINSNLLISWYLHQTRVIIRRLWCGGFNVCYQLRLYVLGISWWRHLMEAKSALLVLCAGNLPVTSGFLSQRPVRRSFDAFFELHLNKRLSKQSWGWWFETPMCSSWRNCNVTNIVTLFSTGQCRHNTVQFNTS